MFSLFCPYSNLGLQLREFLLYYFPYSNKSPTKKGVFLYYCIYFNLSPTKNGVFLYFCFNPKISPAENGVFTLFALILTRALPQRVFYSIYCCPYSYQSLAKNVLSLFLPLFLSKPCHKQCFLHLFKKALYPKRRFSLFLPLF